MKRFKQYLYEEAVEPAKSPAPYGVLFLNQGRTAIVGVPHGKRPHIDPKLKGRVKALAEIHGKYWEGDGGDIEPLKKDFGDKSTYTSGWDDEFIKSQNVKKLEPYHLVGLFGNGNPEQFKNLTNPKTSIFKHIQNNPHLATPHKAPIDTRTFTTFLRQASVAEKPEESVDLLKLAHRPATRENVERFVKAGAELTFPSGKDEKGEARWLSYPNQASKFAERSERERNSFILNKPGVYFAGAGHLNEIQRLAQEHKKDFELHGGELSAT